jgi:excisionase family DNA binding protein
LLPNDPPEENRSDNTATKTNASPELGERFLSVAEVAVKLGVSQKTIRRKISSGELHAQRVGRLLRIRARDLAVYFSKAR